MTSSIDPGLSPVSSATNPDHPASAPRRQYRSCDSCRHGRRACDARRRNASSATSRPRGTGHGSAATSPVPCSNCAKKGKQCTFYWLLDTALHMHGPLVDEFGLLVYPDGFNRLIGPETSRQLQGTTSVSHGWSPNSNHGVAPTSGLQYMAPDLMPIPGPDFTQFVVPEEQPVWPSIQPRSQPTDALNHTQWLNEPLLSSSDQKHGLETATRHRASVSRKHLRKIGWQTRSRTPYSHPQNQSPPTPTDSSPALNDQLRRSSNRLMISDYLVKIYNDSFEHLISCGLTESTNPVSEIVPVRLPPTVSASLADDPSLFYRPQLWFHSLVYHLDSIFGILAEPVSMTDSLAVNRALEKTILAFSSQWSPCNNSHASQSTSLRLGNDTPERLGGTSSELGTGGTNCSIRGDDSKEYKRVLQESLWHEAHQSLQAINHLNSFGAIFARILFSIVQPPRSFSSSADAASRIYLDISLRHLDSWRRKLACLHTHSAAHPKQTWTDTLPTPTQNDIDSFRVIFWLGVMCDTTSAAIWNRPVVIPDEDCISPPQLPDAIISSVTFFDDKLQDLTESDETNGSNVNANVWQLEFLQRATKRHDFRWPCSLTDAAIILRDSSPIKVLLFRRVTYLQSLVARRTSTSKIESSIQKALDVRRSWDATSGPFIDNCIRYHADLPVRFQSWYVLLSAHWYLGLLLLAEAIEMIDHASGVTSSTTRLNDHSTIVSELRISGACKLAELARVSCSSGRSVMHRSIDHGFMFNDGPFLTEPWGDILVQALHKATSVFLDVLVSESLDRSMSSSNNPETYSVPALAYTYHAHDCIWGLEQLAPQSDVANQLAVDLSLRLQQLPDTNCFNNNLSRSGISGDLSVPDDGYVL